MELEKHIPAQAGLGGGSSDAAAVLRGLNRLMKTGLSAEELSDMGKRIGADVPFCITGGCCRCRGIGEKLTKVPGWNGLPLVIVRPPVAVETGKAYAVLDRAEKQTGNKTDACIRAVEEKDRKKLAENLSNDFEKALFAEEPVLDITPFGIIFPSPSHDRLGIRLFRHSGKPGRQETPGGRNKKRRPRPVYRGSGNKNGHRLIVFSVS